MGNLAAKIVAWEKKGSLKEGVRLLLVLAGLPDMLQIPWILLTSSKKVIAGPAAERAEDLHFLAKLAESGDSNRS